MVKIHHSLHGIRDPNCWNGESSSQVSHHPRHQEDDGFGCGPKMSIEGDLSISSASKKRFVLAWTFFASSKGIPEDQKKGASKIHKVEISIVGIWGLNSLSAYCSTSHEPQGIKSLLRTPMTVSCQGATKQIDGTSSSTQNESDASSATSWGLLGGERWTGRQICSWDEGLFSDHSVVL